MLLHEDYPHTIPTRAYLRWKENYFWVFMAPEDDVYCFAHVSSEPTFDRSFVSFTLLHQGKKIATWKEVALPQPFVHQDNLTFGDLRMHIIKPQEEFRVTYIDDVLEFSLDLRRRMHLFDFQACADVNPDQLSISESTAFNRGEFRHQGQCIEGHGTVNFKTGDFAGKSVTFKGNGYRDHSWGMRNDQLTLEHNWTFVNLPSLGFHFVKIHNRARPGMAVMEAYVAHPEGNEVLKTLTITQSEIGELNMPKTVTYQGVSVSGNTYTIVADVAGSFARLPLVSQKPGAAEVYEMVENMCPCRCEETGETGYANVEIGWLHPV